MNIFSFRKKKRIALFLTAVMLGVGYSHPVLADNITDIENSMSSLQSEINELDSELVSLLTDIDILEANIEECEANLEELDFELAAAQEAERQQYNAMKIRMKYMYESRDTSLLTIFLESGSLSDFINRVEYANSVYEYDRNLLETYQATQEEIETMQSEIEDQKATMESEEASLTVKQASLNSMIAAKESQMDDFAVQLEAAKEEAARLAAEAEAARRAAEEAANAAKVTPVVEQAENQTDDSNDSAKPPVNDNNSDDGGGSDAPAGGETPADTAEKPEEPQAAESLNPSPTTGVSGSAVVGYAMQFVGNPYVWGGNSLTEGCDCSGFVVQVYKNFGIDLSGSRSSAAMRNVGQAVTFDCIQPGDIVCYSGHVAIYAGGGAIVEAQSTRAGITANRSVTCKTILAIRRVI